MSEHELMECMIDIEHMELTGTWPAMVRHLNELHRIRDRNITRELMHMAPDYTTFSLLTEMYDGASINEW